KTHPGLARLRSALLLPARTADDDSNFAGGVGEKIRPAKCDPNLGVTEGWKLEVEPWTLDVQPALDEGERKSRAHHRNRRSGWFLPDRAAFEKKLHRSWNGAADKQFAALTHRAPAAQ